MKFPRPRSLNGLILVGFGLVALPLLLAVIWALVNLDRVAEQSEQLVFTGVTAAENNRRLARDVGSLERVARQYQVLKNPDACNLLQQDLVALEAHAREMSMLAEKAGATPLAESIGSGSRSIVETLGSDNYNEEQAPPPSRPSRLLRRRVPNLTGDRLGVRGQRTARAAGKQRAGRNRYPRGRLRHSYQARSSSCSSLSLLVARPIRQLDSAIGQLGESGFSKPIEVKGPTDLERLGRQLEWLRIRLLELAQEKNKFLRHMSHELKTPLANIREGTELLLDGSVGELEQPQREVTDILRMNGLKLQQLIENLLSF